MAAPEIAPPRSRPARAHLGPSAERRAWLFLRVSGVLLIVLVLGHLLIVNVLGDGVQRVNFAFVAGRWSKPFWQVWDLLMLWLAMLHGALGMGTIIEDYSRRTGTRIVLSSILWTATSTMLALGTLVIFTFDPSA
jgi:succinate dehydrogenase / fumarate reductase membrane anchor subunit